MSEADAAWLAGFLEGEGTFMKPAPSAPNTPVVSVIVTDLDVIERAAKLMGGRVHAIKIRRAHWKPTWGVRISGWKAVSFMQFIRPMMGKRRREQIDRAVASVRHFPTGRLTAAEVLEIRRRCANGESQEVIAAHFRVRKEHVSRIANRRFYKWVA